MLIYHMNNQKKIFVLSTYFIREINEDFIASLKIISFDKTKNITYGNVVDLYGLGKNCDIPGTRLRFDYDDFQKKNHQIVYTS